MSWLRSDVELLWKRDGQYVDTRFPLNERNVNSMRVRCQSVHVAEAFSEALLRTPAIGDVRGEDFVHLVDRLVKASYAQAERRMRGRRTR